MKTQIDGTVAPSVVGVVCVQLLDPQQQCDRLHAEAVGEAQQLMVAGVLAATLKPRDVGNVKAGGSGEGLDGEAALLTQFANCTPQQAQVLLAGSTAGHD